MLSLFIFYFVLLLMHRMLRENFSKFSSLIAIVVYWMFNARFINSNPYPFLFFVWYSHMQIPARRVADQHLPALSRRGGEDTLPQGTQAPPKMIFGGKIDRRYSAAEESRPRMGLSMSFNWRMRDELLKENLFFHHAHAAIAKASRNFNECRPHSALASRAFGKSWACPASAVRRAGWYANRRCLLS